MIDIYVLVVMETYSSPKEVNVMKQILDAIYQHGVFRPLQRPQISEGQQVRLVVETSAEGTPDELLELAAQVYQDLSDEQISEIERIAFDRRHFFGDRTP